MLLELGVTRALLLQGPMGPFFKRLAEELQSANIAVTKINLNAGDAVFYRRVDALAYRGTLEGFASFVEHVIREQRIDGVFLFGDGRPYHRKAIEVARRLGVQVFVFEEGYLRPHFITLERGGVNGNSSMPRDPAFFRRWAELEPEKPRSIDHGFGYGAMYSILYSIALTLGFVAYPRYRHHRPLNAFAEAYCWVRGGARKLFYRSEEWRVMPGLVAGKKFFFVALQVHNDYQLSHSRFASVEEFIGEVVASFAAHAPKDVSLVIKHHPMDRPYRDYGKLMRTLARRHELGERLVYVHDVNLPLLLRHALGSVMINSTVGMSSIHHGTPVKVLGDAVYDMPGLTHQGDLAGFWRNPGSVDQALFRGYRYWLSQENQANGNFYVRIPGATNPTGVAWRTSAARGQRVDPWPEQDGATRSQL